MVHPAAKFWKLANIFLILALIFAIVACFLPMWSRIPGTSIPTASFNSQTSTTVNANSKLFMGHWNYCVDYQDSDDTITCAQNDGSSGTTPPDFGNQKCWDFLEASRITGIVGWCLIILALILASMVAKKLASWGSAAAAVKPWKPPTPIAALALLTTLLAFGCLLTSWICWIVLAEHACQGVAADWNPFQGYSYSFILMCFASAWAFIALLCMCLGMKMKKSPPYAEKPVEYAEEYYPGYPAPTEYVYPAYGGMPSMYPAPYSTPYY